ncbi:hypothetical protein BMR07_17130 [Methylococcaceae bacterium CS1]|nr:hypothetical protein BMR07_17130 [Methylococcaceae bacterium CS1]TXL02871.1 hypothetical protein BMR08_17735 [Methylococcaceae bacterium CS2]
MGKIKASETQKKHSLKPQQPSVNYNNNVPIFSLEKLQEGKYCLSGLDKEDKASFADSLFKRKSLSWSQIQQADKHGLGTEKISKAAINAEMPKFVTADFKDFLVFRYSGKKAMVGYRKKDVFFILWFDHNFQLYNHS